MAPELVTWGCFVCKSKHPQIALRVFAVAQTVELNSTVCTIDYGCSTLASNFVGGEFFFIHTIQTIGISSCVEQISSARVPL